MALALALALLQLAPSIAGGSPTGSAAFAALADQRQTMANELRQPIERCIKRHDTTHPVFHGCIDWHSAVHAHWALTALARVTGDAGLLQRVSTLLDPELLAAEQQYLQQHPDFEMPYGRSWFLRLAVEWKRATGDTRLDAFARDVATSLRDYLSDRTFDPRTGSYDSGTWALLNLHLYAASRHDDALMEFVRSKAASADLVACPFDADAQSGSFMAICSNWAWLLAEVSGPDAAADIAKVIPDSASLRPLTEAETPHLAGLDFSRAWGLWHAWRQTNDDRFLAAYVEHFETAFQHEEWWNGRYEDVSHWVAQFGVLALMPAFEADYE